MSKVYQPTEEIKTGPPNKGSSVVSDRERPMIKLVIRGTLPDLNDHIKALSANRYKGGRLKKNTDEAIMWQLKCQLAGVKIKPPVRMHYLWVEPNMKRDLDNIAFARKYIQDALVKLGALANDGWSYISGFSDDFTVDSKYPRIEITIEEVAR